MLGLYFFPPTVLYIPISLKVVVSLKLEHSDENNNTSKTINNVVRINGKQYTTRYQMGISLF